MTNNDIEEQYKYIVMLRAVTTVSWLTKNVFAFRTNVHLTLTISVQTINMHPLSTVWICALYTLSYQLPIDKIILIQAKTGSSLTAGYLCFL